MSVGNVGNPLVRAPTSFNTENFTPDNLMNVQWLWANLLATALLSIQRNSLNPEILFLKILTLFGPESPHRRKA